MTSVNELNAVLRERARIREAVVAIPVHPMYHNPPFGNSANPEADPYIKRSEVLAILNPSENV